MGKQLELDIDRLNNIIDILLENNLSLRKTISEVKADIKSYCSGCKKFEPNKNCQYCLYNRLLKIIKRADRP